MNDAKSGWLRRKWIETKEALTAMFGRTINWVRKWKIQGFILLLLLGYSVILLVSAQMFDPEDNEDLYKYGFTAMIIAFSICFLLIVGVIEEFSGAGWNFKRGLSKYLDPKDDVRAEAESPQPREKDVDQQVEAAEKEMGHPEKGGERSANKAATTSELRARWNAIQLQINGPIRDGYLYYGRESIAEGNFKRAFYDYYNAYSIGPSPLTYLGMVGALLKIPVDSDDPRVEHYFDEGLKHMENYLFESQSEKNKRIISVFQVANRNRADPGKFRKELKRLVDPLL